MPQASEFMALQDVPLPMTCWANPLKISVADLANQLAQDDIKTTPLTWHKDALRCDEKVSLGNHWCYAAGLLQIQEEVSMLPAQLLAPQPGEKVLDLCAAPGNKTAQMSLMMHNQGTLIANDCNYQRLRALSQISKRLGLINISTSVYDGTSFARLNGYFDKVLVDAPCSCQGTFRKNLRKTIQVGEKISKHAQSVQIALLDKALHLARQGGRVMYSTCTFAPEENEAVIDYFCKKYAGKVRVLPLKMPNFKASPGILKWRDQVFAKQVAECWRVWPQQNNTGGFFVALLEKTGEIGREFDFTSEIAHQVATSEIAPRLLDLVERFGIAADVLQDYIYTDASKRGIYMINPDNQPPQDCKLDASGLFFLKTKIKYPKLSTAAAMLLNKHATRHTLILTQPQRDAFFRHQDIDLSKEQISSCTDMGYVMVRYDNYALGLGLLFFRKDGSAVLRSLFPRYF